MVSLVSYCLFGTHSRALISTPVIDPASSIHTSDKDGGMKTIKGRQSVSLKPLQFLQSAVGREACLPNVLNKNSCIRQAVGQALNNPVFISESLESSNDLVAIAFIADHWPKARLFTYLVRMRIGHWTSPTQVAGRPASHETRRDLFSNLSRSIF